MSDDLQSAFEVSGEFVVAACLIGNCNALHHLEPLRATAGVEVRLHSTTLYNSIFRFGDEMLVSSHVYGIPGAHAPLLHLRRLAEGDLFSTYAESVERVWSAARPAWPRRNEVDARASRRLPR